MERDGERQASQVNLSERERERKTHFTFVFNKFALAWETLASGDDFCDLWPSTDFVSQTVAETGARTTSRRRRLCSPLYRRFIHLHQLMNDLCVTLTQIESCRCSRVLFGLRFL